MSDIVLIAGYAKSLLNFRGELIKSLVDSNHRVTAIAPEAGFEKELDTIGAGYVPVPLQRTGLNPLKDIHTLGGLVRTLMRLKPDKVLSYTVKPVIYGSLAARVAGVPHVYSMITGLGYALSGRTLKQRVLARAVRLLYRAALYNNEKVFFQNPDDLNLFVQLNLVAAHKTVLINGSGVDTDQFPFAAARCRPLSFLLIARLVRDKGIGEFVEAARLLKPRYPGVSFKILGPYDTNPAAISPEEVKSWVDEGVIEYLGSTGDVRPYIAEAGVYVLPSYREGTPRSVLEAMAMGRPVITTDAPGCRETVRDGENGFLVPVGDGARLAGAMERFILKPELIPVMGAQSRKIAVEKYDVHKVNRVILRAMGVV